jgi:hypothetical protein
VHTVNDLAGKHVILDAKTFRTDRYYGETNLNRHGKTVDVSCSGTPVTARA